MTTIESPRTDHVHREYTGLAIDLFSPQDQQHRVLHNLDKCCRLTHKPFDGTGMILVSMVGTGSHLAEKSNNVKIIIFRKYSCGYYYQSSRTHYPMDSS